MCYNAKSYIKNTIKVDYIFKVKKRCNRHKELIMESKFSSVDLTAGQLNDIVIKLGGHEEALRFLRDEELVAEPKKWREQDGVIYFSVTSDGTTGEEWIVRLEKKGFKVSQEAKKVLCSDDFKSSSGVTTEIAVLKSNLWYDHERTTRVVRNKASGFGLVTPNGEVACLIREAFSDKDIEDMGLWRIVIMHEPIMSSDNFILLLLCVGKSWLKSFYGDLSIWWQHGNGFAFALSQVPGS